MFDPEQITFFAKTDSRGQQVPFGIKAIDRTKHVYVIGKTGMGKSTLLENMAVQDIKNGNGLAFIDPHGQTAETLLDYIPEERMKDVLYFAPFDTANPVSFNVMEDVGADKRHLVVSGLMSVFKKIWVDAWSARMEYILSNTLLALLEYPDSTLLGVNRMLSEKDYRKRVIDNITDPAVKSFWVDEFLKYNERYMQEAGDAIKNKIGQFTSNPLIRNIIGQPHSSFDIRDIMDNQKIMIINLSKGLVGEQNANLLGSMITTRMYLAAMSRADLTAAQMKEMPNFYFYVDEFQSFANATFADILSEARKYKLNLTIAHQYVAQMEDEVRDAVFGNVGTIISFRVGPFDAEVLETVYTPKFLAPDIVNLGFAQIYLTLMIDGIGSQPFSAVTLPPIEVHGESFKEMVIAQSREKFTLKREGVEETIHAWHAKSFSDKPPYIPKHLREDAGPATDTKKLEGKTSAPVRTTGNSALKSTVVAAVPVRTTGNSSHKSSPAPVRTTGKDASKNVSATPARTVWKPAVENASAAPTRTAGSNDRKNSSADTSRGAEPKNHSSSLHSTQADRADATPVASRDAEPQRTERTQSSVPPRDDKQAASGKAPQRTTGKPAKSEKSLDDLRSVLKNLSGDDTKKEKNPQKNLKKDEHELSKSESGQTLKNALAAAMADVTEKSDSRYQAVTGAHEKETKPQEKTQKPDRYTADGATHSGSKEEKSADQSTAVAAIPDESAGDTKNSSKSTVDANTAKASHTHGSRDHMQESRMHTAKSHDTSNTAQGKHGVHQSQKTESVVQKEREVHIHSHSAVRVEQKTELEKTTPEVVQGTPARVSSAEATEYAQMKNIDDPLSPKKLERMMRVTTQDKPPLK
jgi:hypothetical protein